MAFPTANLDVSVGAYGQSNADNWIIRYLAASWAFLQDYRQPTWRSQAWTWAIRVGIRDYVFGGRGRPSRKTPEEFLRVGD